MITILGGTDNHVGTYGILVKIYFILGIASFGCKRCCTCSTSDLNVLRRSTDGNVSAVLDQISRHSIKKSRHIRGNVLCPSRRRTFYSYSIVLLRSGIINRLAV